MLQTLRTLADELSNAGYAMPARHVYSAVIELMEGAATGDMEAATEAAHEALTAAYDTATKAWQAEIWDAADALRRHTHTATVRRAIDAVAQAISEKYPADSVTVTAGTIHGHIEAALQAIEAADNEEEAHAHGWTAGYLLDALTAVLSDLDMFERNDPAERAAEAALYEAITEADSAIASIRHNE